MMTSTSPHSPQDPDTQRADEMHITGSEKQDSPIQVVVEALPDIESADAHALGVTVANGKEVENINETDDGEDVTSENASDVDSGRDVKRVKLDTEGGPELAAVVPEQGEAGASKDAQSEEKAADDEDETFELRMTWAGRGFDIRIQGSDRLYDFKAMIYSLTSVPPERQKLIGLVKGKIPGDETFFKDLAIPGSGVRKFACVGTPQEMTFMDPSEIDPKHLPDVMDDFDVSYKEQAVKPADDPRNQRLVRHRIENCQIDIMNEPRPGKALLVLDLDYTIVDTEPLLKGSLPTAQCLRPGLHEFLEKAYEWYDIAVWSQTHWRWLESKLVEMGMIGDPTRRYKICFVTDKTTMFPIFGTRDGKAYKHEVKPLQFIWAKFPQWSAKNTIHIDDSRNFALNPAEGLKIRAYKKAGTAEGARDDQLMKLGRYLEALARLPDFTTADHRLWKKYKFPAWSSSGNPPR